MALVIVLFLIFSFTSTQLFANYLVHPVLFVLLLVPVAGLLLTGHYRARGRLLAAWVASAVLIGGTTLFGVVGIFPALLPSSLNPAWSLTIANSSSSPLTLAIMLGVAIVFVPLVIAYQAWTMHLFRHPVTQKTWITRKRTRHGISLLLSPNRRTGLRSVRRFFFALFRSV